MFRFISMNNHLSDSMESIMHARTKGFKYLADADQREAIFGGHIF
jgi:hypothetical protein